MAYEQLWEPDGVVRKFSGKVSAREFINSVEQVQGDARFDDARYVINDFSLVTEHGLSEEALTEAAILQYGAYASNPNCRVVFVTTDALLAGLVKDSQATSQLKSYQTEVLPTLTEARDWLDSQPQLQLMSNVMGFRIE